MKPSQLLLFTVLLSPLVFSQEEWTIKNPYPKFLPYVIEENTTKQYFAQVQIKDLGKEQPVRWLSVDPLADKYPGWTPYNYTLNNPLRFIDPNGDSVRTYVEKEGVGHTWLSFGEGEQMTIFTYGRYAGTDTKSGIETISNGPGVLVKLEGQDAMDYNGSKLKNGNVAAFTIKDINEQDLSNLLNKKFQSSSVIPGIGPYANDPRARVIDRYDIIKNNCTTFVISELNKAGSKVMNSLVTPGENYRTFIPHQLQSHLEFQSAIQLNGNGSAVRTLVPR